MPETLAVHTKVLQHSAAGPQPLRRSAPSNLPAQPTTFVGRQAEMAAVKVRFAGARLLTLTGTGGAGKTRLALQVAAELLPARADGVWLVELSSLSDPELVPAAVASTLGLHEPPDRTPLESLAEYLPSKQMLLVLDNCEHLVQAAAKVAETLLRACPDLWILATSREALGIAGESLWPVPRLREHDGMELFLDRATAIVPSFSATAANRPIIARICRRLDGMPLAIELAAALVKVLSVTEIDARLHERFRLLTTGSRTAPPRQKTLRGTVDWSYDLLSASERVLWRRLSVFAGGFTLAAVEAVCADDDLPPAEVLELLFRLVDKSLVIAKEYGAEKRFRLLETMRQYGMERLREAAETAAKQSTTDEQVLLTATSDADAVININGQSVGTGTGSLTVALAMGPNTFSATAKDKLGNEGSATVTVERLPLPKEEPTPKPAPAPEPTPEPVPPSPKPAPFTDLEGHWSADAVQRMVDMGVISGYEDHTFRPESQVTRLEFAVMIARALKLVGADGTLTFTDHDQIPEWAKGLVAAAANAGIVQGRQTGGFDPNAPVTRSEVSVMLARALKFKGIAGEPASPTAFTDAAEIPDWAAEAVALLTQSHVVAGFEDGTFRPSQQTTRGEAATMLSRFLDLH